VKERREQDRARYQPPGPNWVWHVDGHDKFNNWGIQIYFAVDAYSRFIVWWYVGIENRTRLSVVKQYLETLRKVGVFPATVQSDRGNEVPLAANAQYEFRRVSCTQEELHALQFDDCWIYGTSKRNSRVEGLWNQLVRRATARWIVFFHGILNYPNVC